MKSLLLLTFLKNKSHNKELYGNCITYLLLLFLLSTSVYANTEVVAPADTIDEVQPLNKVLRVQHQTGVRAAYLDLLEWELFDNEEYSSEEILSGNIKGTPHPFDLNSDTVVQKLPSEIWIQAKFTIPESHFNTYVFLSFKLLGETQVYWNGELIESYGAADTTGGNSPHLVARSVNFDRLQFSEDSLQTLTFRMNIEHIKSAKNKLLSTPDLGILSPELYFLQEEISAYKNDRLLYRTNQTLMWAFGFCLMIIALLNIGLEGVTKVKINELAIGFLLIFVGIAALNIDLMFFGYDFFLAIHIPSQIAILLIFLSIPNHIALKANKFTRRQKIYNSVFLLLFIDIIFPLDFLRSTLFGDFAEDMFLIIFLLVIMLHIGEAIYTSYKQNKAGQKEFLVFLIAFFLMLIGIAGRFLFYFFPAIFNQFFNLLLISFITLSVPLALLVIPIFEVIYTNRKLRDSLDENEQLNNLKLKAEQEKKTLIESRKKELEKEVKSRTSELGKAYENLKKSHEELKAAQSQLVQQEKLASLGQLTAGIAHEIKNPLNFVNNFSDLSVELIEEVREEIQNSGVRSQNSEVLEILDNIEANLRKIHEHGSRADSIVKSMLQHSRGGSGKMESTDLNALVKEYVNLSFHGKRAGKNPINVDIQFELNEEVGEVPLIVEDFSRVIVNLCNNAFDAMREKLNSESRILNSEEYKPKLLIRSQKHHSGITLEIEDNGPGIPEEMKDKILQPFFTTKKGTEGTGLGLSITNDIVKAHGGEIGIESKSQGVKFILYMNKN